MIREDLRTNIIPVILRNDIDLQDKTNKRYRTKDFIYIESFEDIFGNKGGSSIERRITATDFAIMNNLKIVPTSETVLGEPATAFILRSTFSSNGAMIASAEGSSGIISVKEQGVGIRPALRYKIPSNLKKKGILDFFKTETNQEELDIREVKDENGNVIRHVLMLGEYPGTNAEDNISALLEGLYNNGKLQEGISATGRWFSSNGEEQNSGEYLAKHNPEFEYNGERFVRVIQFPPVNVSYNRYSNGSIIGKRGMVKWVKVEPISFEIMNWDNMPTSINPNGNGKASCFELRAEKAIIANISFNRIGGINYTNMWQHSPIRGFLNGISDIHANDDATRTEKKKSVRRVEDFVDGCSFINEAFNLGREPIIEYEIPHTQYAIPDDAFNGCVTLKRIKLHPQVSKFGRRIFDGLDIKYAYRTSDDCIIFDAEKPKGKAKALVNLQDMTERLKDFDYEFFNRRNAVDSAKALVEILKKYDFAIPYEYAIALCEERKAKQWAKKSEFRFFKEKLPTLIDEIMRYPRDERRNFFKFANALGCFSKQKILNKNGDETEVILAQKACTFLSKLIRRDEMQLRKLSWNVL